MIKRLIWLGIILTLAALAIPLLLQQFSIYIENLSSDSDTVEDTTTIVLPPLLDAIPSATNSAQLAISGYADQASRIEIFVNEISKKEIRIASSDKSFATKVPLYQGENTITVISYDEDGNKSETSNPISVLYKSEGPELIIDSPEDNQEIKGDTARVQIKGITDIGASVTINDRWVKVKSDGTFIYDQRLNEGDNTITIISTGPAGNVSTTTRRVRYSK